ncbi:hypothetical protein N7G274_006942 [Stereocaulon virgatum]|uniref:Phospholipase/carboxylesterase/thioesterase domain-containing protein n=1 Tax=Stereocaulon virgatum TaxID=373712 RepID=A0ABR4A3K0_9LECA
MGHSKSKSGAYPDPLIVSSTLSCKETFIILHGRGSNAEKFSSALLDTKLPDGQTFQTVFPHAKFVFPTASRRRAVVYNRSFIHQWFDNWTLDKPSKKEELQIEGLCETSAYIHDLLQKEIAIVGAKNVVLGGLSQGCAVSLASLLTWEGEPYAAQFGMCGWIPFRTHMADIVNPDEVSDKAEDGEPDLFAHDPENDSEEISPAAQAVAYLREELDLPVKSQPSMAFQHVQLFLGHGVEDEKVPFSQGKDTGDLMKRLGIDVTWKEYEGLAHWYSSAMLGHLVEWLREKTKWDSTEGTTEQITVDR